jgi:transmembrane protein EpsG
MILELINYSLFMLTLIFISNIKVLKLTSLNKAEINYKVFSFNKRVFWILGLFFIYYGWRNTGLGSDFRGYVEAYNLIMLDDTLYSYYYKDYEIGFEYLTYIFTSLGMPYQIFFGFIGMLAYLFLIKGVYKFAFLLPLTLYFLFTEGYFAFSHSGVRQSLAMAIIFYAIKFIIEKKIITYLYWMIFASLFHVFSLVMIPIYFLRRLNFYGKIYLALYGLALSGILNEYFLKLIHLISEYSTSSFFLQSYYHFLESDKFYKIDSLGVGMGQIIKFISIFWVVHQSKKVLSIQPDLKIYFTVAFLGALLQAMFWNIEVIARISLYFIICLPIVLASVIYYSTSQVEKLISYGIVFLNFLLFLATVDRLYTYIG